MGSLFVRPSPTLWKYLGPRNRLYCANIFCKSDINPSGFGHGSPVLGPRTSNVIFFFVHPASHVVLRLALVTGPSV